MDVKPVNSELLEAAERLEQIRQKIQTLMDEVSEILIERPGVPGDIAWRSFSTWIFRIESALAFWDDTSHDYTMEDAIREIREW